MTDDAQLLRQYAQVGSESAFGELVRRHVDLVYSAALRVVGGDSHLARDVTQVVFIDLARKASSLRCLVSLGGWLHRHTCYTAAKAVRTERRRCVREQTAMEMRALDDNTKSPWELIAPHLDEGLNQLSAADRTALVLRFLQRRDLRAVGTALGVSEDAAQKRVGRALEKLRGVLSQRGIALASAGLASALAAEAVTAAPAGLALSVTGASLAAAAGSGTTLTLLRFMATTKLKTGVISVVIVASVVMPLVVRRQAQARLREQDDAWQRQTNQLAQVTADNQRLANHLAQAKNTRPLSDNQLLEVLRLRSEVGRLRRNVQEMTSAKTALPVSPEDQLASMKKMYAAQVDRLKQWLETNPSEKIPELQNLKDEDWVTVVGSLAIDDDFARAARLLRANAEMRVFDTLWPALRKYARDNNGQFPTDLSELKPYFKSPIDDAILQRYGILPASSLVSELQPGGDWVITEKAAANPALDLRSAYGLTQMRIADERVTNRWTLVH